MKNYLFLIAFIFIAFPSSAANLRIKNWTTCANIYFQYKAHDNNNTGCQSYSRTIVVNPGTVAVPYVVTYSDPTAINPWNPGAVNLLPANNPDWDGILIGIPNQPCNLLYLPLNCGSGSSSYIITSTCGGGCSNTGSIQIAFTTVAGVLQVDITEY